MLTLTGKGSLGVRVSLYWNNPRTEHLSPVHPGVGLRALSPSQRVRSCPLSSQAVHINLPQKLSCSRPFRQLSACVLVPTAVLWRHPGCPAPRALAGLPPAWGPGLELSMSRLRIGRVATWQVVNSAKNETSSHFLMCFTWYLTHTFTHTAARSCCRTVSPCCLVECDKYRAKVARTPFHPSYQVRTPALSSVGAAHNLCF